MVIFSRKMALEVLVGAFVFLQDFTVSFFIPFFIETTFTTSLIILLLLCGFSSQIVQVEHSLGLLFQRLELVVGGADFGSIVVVGGAAALVDEEGGVVVGLVQARFKEELITSWWLPERILRVGLLVGGIGDVLVRGKRRG